MNRKLRAPIILDISIAVCTALCLHLLYNFMEPGSMRRLITGAVLLPLIVLIIFEAIYWNRPNRQYKERSDVISTLILLGEDGRPIRIWDLTGKVGLLIGKSSDEYQVDIDLAETDYHAFIDPEHAILNYQESGWWLQDTSSRNGVSIVRKGNELLLGSYAPAKLEPGDVICIAHYTRIAVN